MGLAVPRVAHHIVVELPIPMRAHHIMLATPITHHLRAFIVQIVRVRIFHPFPIGDGTLAWTSPPHHRSPVVGAALEVSGHPRARDDVGASRVARAPPFSSPRHRLASLLEQSRMNGLRGLLQGAQRVSLHILRRHWSVQGCRFRC